MTPYLLWSLTIAATHVSQLWLLFLKDVAKNENCGWNSWLFLIWNNINIIADHWIFIAETNTTHTTDQWLPFSHLKVNKRESHYGVFCKICTIDLKTDFWCIANTYSFYYPSALSSYILKRCGSGMHSLLNLNSDSASTWSQSYMVDANILACENTDHLTQLVLLWQYTEVLVILLPSNLWDAVSQARDTYYIAVSF